MRQHLFLPVLLALLASTGCGGGDPEDQLRENNDSAACLSTLESCENTNPAPAVDDGESATPNENADSSGTTGGTQTGPAESPTTDTPVVPATNYVQTYWIWDISTNGELIELSDGSFWEVGIYSNRSSIWLEFNDVVVCGDDMVNVTRGNGVDVTWVGGTISSWCPASSQYYISQNISSGDFIKLNDGSLWEIDSFDSFYSTFWFSLDDIVVTSSGSLVNLDDRSSVGATRLN